MPLVYKNMSTAKQAQCVPCLDCDDSPLSTVASVAGILTFIYALAAGIYVYFRTAKNTPQEMQQMLRLIQFTESELEVFIETRRNAPKYEERGEDPLSQAMREAEDATQDAGEQLIELRNFFEKRFYHALYHGRVGILERSQFILQQETLLKKIEEQEKARDRFR